MDAIQFNPEGQYEFNLQQSVVEVINSKIKKTDLELQNILNGLHNPDQKPGRARDLNSSWDNNQKQIFEFIESSSRIKTKLFYLRVRVTDLNSSKILKLITSSRLHELTLQELKEEIR